MKLKLFDMMRNDLSSLEDDADLQLHNALMDVVARDEIKARKDTCKLETLFKRPHDDHDHDNHEGKRIIKRIKRKGFDMMKKRFTNIIEFEYNLEQVALVMSEDIGNLLIEH
ncbi:hypothetical protein Tco_0931938 [Tanacetum coccineum]